MQCSHVSTTRTALPRQLGSILKFGSLPDALDPGFHCVRTHWIRGFMAVQLVRYARIVMLMVPAWPESVFRKVRPPAAASLAGLRKRTRVAGVT